MPPISNPETLFTLPDGRTLSYSIFGAADNASAPTVFYFHSCPGSRVEALLLHPACVAGGVRLIAPDRPGMGQSTFLPERRLLDWPLDLLALADHLKVETFGTIATSGGGPYALACCLKIPRNRLKAAGIVAGIYPKSLGTQGMLLENRVMLYLAPWATGLVAAALDWYLVKPARDTERPENYEAVVANGFERRPQVDRNIFHENVARSKEILLESMREAVRGGAQGPAHELKLYGSHWGFELEDVKMRKDTLVLWHGGLDWNVPRSMAEKAASRLDCAEFRLSPEEGHISLSVNKADEAIATIKGLLEE